MNIIGWILFGLVVGLLARAIMPGRDSMGLLATAVLGIVGAVVAGWVGHAFGWYTTDSGAGLIAATIGAIVVLAIYNSIVTRRSRRKVDTTVDRDLEDRNRKDRGGYAA
jgi:uncharacterized membrane protein YeaQ/YmgE (transglycosylase-associated protein family)